MILRRLPIVLLTSIILTGCGIGKEIPASAIRQIDTVYLSKIETEVVRDSIYLVDKEYIHEKGDTVFVEKWKTEYRDRWHNKEVHDTLYVDREIEKEVIKEVEKDFTWGQSTLIGLGKAFLGLIALVIIYIIIKICAGKLRIKSDF